MTPFNYIDEYLSKYPRQNLFTAIKNFLTVIFYNWLPKIWTDDVPWLPINTTAYVKKLMKNQIPIKIAEFGGGSSTIYFLKSGAEVTTIEHNPKWFYRLKKAVSEANYKEKWVGKLNIPQKIKPQKKHDFSDPKNYLSSEANNLSYKKYATALDKYQNNYFDLILVDGRARPSCVVSCIKKIKKSGYLVLDNTERNYYLNKKVKKNLTNFVKIFDEYGPVFGLNHFNRSTIFKKK